MNTGMMQKCQACGAEIGIDADPCPKCGQKHPNIGETTRGVLHLIVFAVGGYIIYRLHKAGIFPFSF